MLNNNKTKQQCYAMYGIVNKTVLYESSPVMRLIYYWRVHTVLATLDYTTASPETQYNVTCKNTN